MFRRHWSRALVLGLSLALAAPAAWAAPHRTYEQPAWNLVTQLWFSLSAGWSDVGFILDPHGGCRDNQAPALPNETATWDEGCSVDPDGGCGR